jgi:hypothetical protein
MLRKNFSRITCLVIAITSLTLAGGISAQESDNTAKAKRRGPLPSYFGKIGVDDDQRKKLYSVQESYQDKLAALRKEMKALLAQRDTEMEALLTPGQKLRLQELKADAVKKVKKEFKPAAKKSEN